MKQSDFLKLNWRDFLMGWIMAIGTPIIYVVQELIPSWDIDPIYKVAISASLTYLIKNFFTSSEKPNIQKLLDEQKEDVGIPKPRP